MEALSISPTLELASFLKAAADPVRLNVLNILGQGAFAVQELCDITGLAQPRLSHHLKLLNQSGWVTTRREGNIIYYRRALLSGDELAQSLLTTLDRTPLDTNAHLGLKAVEQQRSLKAQQFFTKHAANIGEKQDLIAGFQDWEDQLEQLLDNLDLSPEAKALELGPGEGPALPLLARRFDQVTAIDISADMIHLAQAHAETKKLSNVAFFNGDLNAFHKADKQQYDVLLVGMVLHHLPQPQSFFNEAFPCLKPGGRIILIDLMPHQQNWASETCGDLWMGFDTNELDQWAQRAGFATEQRLYAGLRTGFQIQSLIYSRLNDKKEHHHE